MKSSGTSSRVFWIVLQRVLHRLVEFARKLFGLSLVVLLCSLNCVVENFGLFRRMFPNVSWSFVDGVVRCSLPLYCRMSSNVLYCLAVYSDMFSEFEKQTAKHV